MPALPTSQPYWVATLAGQAASYPRLSSDIETDVAIVGAGIVGLTAAELLKRAGKTVAVLEAREVGRQATGTSTAKVTSQHNLIYRKLIKDFGEDGARTYADANQAAIGRVAEFVRELGIDCAFERKAAYVYARSDDQVAAIEAEVEAASRLGLPASFTREAPLPFSVPGAIRFDDQAQFNPCRYLLGLAAAVAQGGHVFEGTRAMEIENGEPCRITTDQGGVVTADEVIVATQMPTIPEGKFFAKAYPFSHPMVAAPIDPDRAPDGMFISADEPSHSFRVDRSNGGAYLVAVGGTYKTGHAEDEMAMLDDLERFLKEAFGVEAVDYRWTNKDFGSMDGVPFIGRASSSAQHLYVATGFNAWGLTNGTAAGMILSDLVLGQANPWAELFDATRIKPKAGGPAFIKENLRAADHLVRGRLRKSRLDEDALSPGEGAILEIGGERVAAFKDESGRTHTLSAICTHMGCVVGWNPIDRTWDCPCHGSRFDHDGRVLNGPAALPLDRKSPPRQES